ncbi:hypothetical protein J5J01_23205 [Streptomyces fradiae]|nr:hypothetical protein J5J01_23205 [Streptomyces fradiae]
MTPPRARTWGRIGCTPVVRVRGRGSAVQRGLKQIQYRPDPVDGCLTGTGLITDG